jgi:hypothetical protein
MHGALVLAMRAATSGKLRHVGDAGETCGNRQEADHTQDEGRQDPLHFYRL